MKESARAAVAEDVAPIADLIEGLEAELRPMRGGAIWAARDARQTPVRASVSIAIHDPHQRVVVGTIDDVVVGVGIARFETMHSGESLAVITELVVDPSARAVGIGEAIAAAIVAEADQFGCVGVDAMALPGHRATKNFFEGQGFVARSLTMHRTLRPPKILG